MTFQPYLKRNMKSCSNFHQVLYLWELNFLLQFFNWVEEIIRGHLLHCTRGQVNLSKSLIARELLFQFQSSEDVLLGL